MTRDKEHRAAVKKAAEKKAAKIAHKRRLQDLTKELWPKGKLLGISKKKPEKKQNLRAGLERLMFSNELLTTSTLTSNPSPVNTKDDFIIWGDPIVDES